MIKLEIKDKTYEVPNGWDEVTVGHYQTIVETNGKDNHSAIEKLAIIISSISGIKIDDIYSMPSDTFKMIIKELEFLSTDMDLKPVSSEYVMVGDEKYYFYNKYSDLTVAETINIDLFMGKYDNQLHLCIPDLLTIFLRKKKEDGSWEEYTTEFSKRRDSFLDLKITDVNGVVSFFSNSEK